MNLRAPDGLAAALNRPGTPAMVAPANQEDALANWVGLKTFRTNAPVWVNLDEAAVIRAGAAAFAEATQIVIPGQPDLYVSDKVEDVVAMATGRRG